VLRSNGTAGAPFLARSLREKWGLARVERALLPAAFDADFDFDLTGEPGRVSCKVRSGLLPQRRIKLTSGIHNPRVTSHLALDQKSANYCRSTDGIFSQAEIECKSFVLWILTCNFSAI
jgi:hypothetical protein